MRRALRPAVVLLAAALIGGCGDAGPPALPPAGTHADALHLGALSASGAGHRFYEIYEPAGRAQGTMLMLHSGGWKDRRGDARRATASTSLAFRAQGWRVIDVSYSPGYKPRGTGLDPRPMMRDVVAFYDQAHRAFPGPLCAYGESAGGHLAAMLALQRPALSCAILNAAPLDLPGLLRDASPAGRKLVLHTFGRSPRVLAAWSPARQWRAQRSAVPVFATGADNDRVVPPQQLDAFRAADPDADVESVPGATAGAPDSVPWMHGVARLSRLQARLTALSAWLDRVVVQPAAAATAPAATAAGSAGGDCAVPATGAGRSRLMLAGGAWRQGATAGQPIVATRGCSGTQRWQDDGLSLWTLPTAGTVLRTGAEASLTLVRDAPVRRVTATFRGYLSHPRDWEVGLYAATGAGSRREALIAGCVRGRCTRMRGVAGAGGLLLAAAGSHGDPDRAAHPRPARLRAPAGTRRLRWRLRCVAPQGCALTPPGSTRRRDPLGHPAIFSLYDVRLG